MYKPFVDARVRDLLEIQYDNPLTLAQYESERIEYKESFHITNERVVRTFAAFANNVGGYIIFGVKDTRELVGLSPSHIKKFDDFDEKLAARVLNKYFSPAIKFVPKSISWRGKNLGIIYVYESKYKPVVATQNAFNGAIREGDIFYSYQAVRERIKYPELTQILEERSTRHTREFWKHLETILKIGVENAAIMNTEDGEVVGPKIKSFVIDSELIEELKFIKEGEFKERRGDPTLRLIGDLATVTDDAESIRTYMSREDLLEDFLNQVTVANPRDYLKRATDGNTKWIPIYFYIHQAKFSLSEAIDYVSSLRTTRLKQKEDLIERLSSSDDLREPLKRTETEISEKRINYREQLVNKESIITDEDNYRYLIYAILSLKRHEVSEQTLDVLRYLFNQFYDYDSNNAGLLRKAICHIDRLLFREMINESQR